MAPAVMTSAKLAAWQALGSTHVSFGVQTLDPRVNEAHSRERRDCGLVVEARLPSSPDQRQVLVQVVRLLSRVLC